MKLTGSVAGTKLPTRIELQAYSGGHWFPFKTVALRKGKFSGRYRFTRTFSSQRYRFRAVAARRPRLPVRGRDLAGRRSARSALGGEGHPRRAAGLSQDRLDDRRHRVRRRREQPVLEQRAEHRVLLRAPRAAASARASTDSVKRRAKRRSSGDATPAATSSAATFVGANSAARSIQARGDSGGPLITRARSSATSGASARSGPATSVPSAMSI